MKVLEANLAANNGGKGFLFGNSMTFADVTLFQLIRGFRSSRPKEFKAADYMPLIKAHTQRMESDQRIKDFLASDKSTKMEDATSTPTAKPPHVQVNSFM